MANCPYYRNGCCKRKGMLMTSGLLGEKNVICRGRQIQGMRYTDCRYYVKPNRGITESMKPCPLAKRMDYGSYYKALCYSKKRPGTKDGKTGVLMPDDSEDLAICLGKTIRGKKYTSCPYYYRVTRSVEKQQEYDKKQKKKQKAQARSEESRWDDEGELNLNHPVAAMFVILVIALIACRVLGIL